MQRRHEEDRHRVPEEEKTSWEAVVEREGRYRTLVIGEEDRVQ